MEATNLYQSEEFYIRTQDELDQLLVYWMDMLNMQGWEIYATFKDKETMGRNLGISRTEEVKKQALIIILRHDMYIDSNYKWDMEQTLVHELLHAYYGVFDTYGDVDSNETAEWNQFHQNIDSMAKTLVRLKRSHPILLVEKEATA